MGRLLVRLAAFLIAAFAALVLLAAVDAARHPVGDLAKRVPARTALMKQREAQARAKHQRYAVDQRWVPYERISPRLRRAILVAEDDAFYQHGGFDWNEIQASARKNLEKRRVVRGGSTITQQLAKNLYAGEDRTPWRKLKEMFLAWRIERALTKRRIFELYLNLIEWGDGIYGAEAAARRHFHVSAAALSERQAVLLAAIVINPRKYSALAPSKRIESRVRMIAGRLRRRGFLDAAQYAAAIGAAPPPQRSFTDWLFGKSQPKSEVPMPTPAESDSGVDAGPDAAPEDSAGTPP